MAAPEGKTLDLQTLEYVDTPALPPPPAAETKEEVVDDPPKEEEEQEEETPTEESKEEGKEGEVEEQPVDEGKKEEEKPSEGKEESIGIDQYLSETYKEKFNIESEEDLQATLESIQEVDQENAQLRARIKELEEKPGKPVFASEAEEKAYEFIKRFPIDKMGEGASTYARLITMNVDTLEPRSALEEKFILEHDELTREEAQLKFNRDFKRKYTARPEDFPESETDFKEEQRMLDITLKSDAAKAKQFLSKQQKEFKPAENTAAVKQEAESSAVVQEGVRTNISELNEYMADLDELKFTEEDGTSFNYKFSREQKALIKQSLEAWIGNPSAYDEKGKVRGGYEVEDNAVKAAAMLFLPDLLKKAYQAGLSQGEIKRADQIATHKPTRVARTVDGGQGRPQSEEKQWEDMIAKKKLKPKKASY